MMKKTSPPPAGSSPRSITQTLFQTSMDGYLVAQKCEQVVLGAVIIICVIHIVYSLHRDIHMCGQAWV